MKQIGWECPDCLGSGDDYRVMSSVPWEQHHCSRCHGDGWVGMDDPDGERPVSARRPRRYDGVPGIVHFYVDPLIHMHRTRKKWLRGHPNIYPHSFRSAFPHSRIHPQRGGDHLLGVL